MQRGLSLVELLLVLALIGLLAGVAYPTYSDQLRRAARSEVIGLLHDSALRLEYHHARVGQYADDDQLHTPLPEGSRFYRLSAWREKDRYRLLAERLPGEAMAQDECGDYQLDQAGRRDNLGATDAAKCW
ncbi:prepilin-type N-terminal cleavage/methylation domain-containing protein [Pseudomonas sp. S75]|uniref:type IV pilin protein n=1 Tax=unclassified Pseudomonas TaxID=196821 RepID=UPI001904FEB5|nr:MULTISPECIES: type IV pilin protein [unclassified Pseudomonas]MBJ9976312.1 prepilin-type N-terminal cleavage/methylation domain-containing protein [Pseudomonas sp. S30]MBK0156075.1 prepilin-type N-terminal cleavage/methylation domain-containing protein [Pseudomonas sp. S75]